MKKLMIALTLTAGLFSAANLVLAQDTTMNQTANQTDNSTTTPPSNSSSGNGW